MSARCQYCGGEWISPHTCPRNEKGQEKQRGFGFERRSRDLKISRRIPASEIEAAQTPRGGWTRATLAAWGVPWPPPKGWRRALTLPGTRAEVGKPTVGAKPKGPLYDGDDPPWDEDQQEASDAVLEACYAESAALGERMARDRDP